jgi:hypothetical protein
MTLIRALDLAEDDRCVDDPGAAKAFVMAEFARLVEEGRAVMATLEVGTLELRLATGEIFHLGKDTVTRIA